MNNLIHKQKENLYSCVLLAIGLYICYFQIFGFDLRYIIGDLGDSRFISSIIEYNYQWMLGNYETYWDGFFMYPDKEVISYSDNLLGITPFYTLFRISGANHLTAYQLVILLCHLLNFFTAYYCFYKITGNKFAATTGAFIFAFNLSVNSIHNHPQFTFRFAAPLAFYSLFVFLKSGQNKFIYLFAFWLTLQFYLGIYLGYFLIVFAAVFALVYVLSNRERIRQMANLKKLFSVLASLVLFIIAVLPVFYFYYKRNKITGYYNNYQEILETVPHLKSYFIPFSSAYSFDFLKDLSVSSKFPWFHQLFPGFVVLLSIACSLYLAIKQKSGLLVALLSTLGFFLVFATNFNGHSIYHVLQEIPGFSAIRVVSRFILLSTFIYGWLLALNLAGIKSGWLKNTLLICLPLILFFDNYCAPGGFSRYEKEEAFRRINHIASQLKSEEPKNLVFAYMPKTEEESFKVQIDAMQTAVYLKAKTINGYSSSCHGSFGPFWVNHDSLGLVSWCKAMGLDQANIRIVK